MATKELVFHVKIDVRLLEDYEKVSGPKITDEVLSKMVAEKMKQEIRKNLDKIYPDENDIRHKVIFVDQNPSQGF